MYYFILYDNAFSQNQEKFEDTKGLKIRILKCRKSKDIQNVHVHYSYVKHVCYSLVLKLTNLRSIWESYEQLWTHDCHVTRKEDIGWVWSVNIALKRTADDHSCLNVCHWELCQIVFNMQGACYSPCRRYSCSKASCIRIAHNSE